MGSLVKPRQPRAVATREALIGACARQLAAVGYAATTTATIASEAGVSRGALQYAFGDRTDLMVAMVREGYERLVSDLSQGASTEGTVAERVATHIETMVRAYSEPTAIAAYEVLLGERANPRFLTEHGELLRSAEEDLDRLWLDTFADTGAGEAAIRAARRVARAAVLGLVARSLPLGADDATAAALTPAVTALLDPR